MTSLDDATNKKGSVVNEWGGSNVLRKGIGTETNIFLKSERNVKPHSKTARVIEASDDGFSPNHHAALYWYDTRLRATE